MKEKERLFDKESMKLKSEKMTISQVNENQMSRNELFKKKSLQEKGITLIALVVTIIILLILAGVTLNMALSQDGLFSKTQEAAEKYKQAQSDEEEMVRQIATQMYSEYVGATVTGYTPKPTSQYQGGYTIDGTKSGLGTDNKDTNDNTITGAEADGSQTFIVDENIKWRIWDFDGNTLRIIADPTNDTLALEGVIGYNNGVYLMNDICEKLYGKFEEDGSIKKGISVSNLRKSDIQRVSTYDYTEYKHEPNTWNETIGDSTEDSIYYGEVIKYSDISTDEKEPQYPKMWDEYDKEWNYQYENGDKIGVDKEGTKWETIGTEEERMNNETIEGDISTEFKQSYYAHDYKQDEFINDEYYDLIFKTSAGRE